MRFATSRESRKRPAPATPATPSDVREAALRILDRSRRTRSELAKKLLEKGHASTEIEPMLDRLAEVGLLDDVEYARAFLAGRWGRKPAGWRRLEMELKKKGVSSPDILAARAQLEERDQAGDEVAAARRVIAHTERRYAALEPRVRRQRLFALLLRRGFDTGVIEQAMRPEPGGV